MAMAAEILVRKRSVRYSKFLCPSQSQTKNFPSGLSNLRLCFLTLNYVRAGRPFPDFSSALCALHWACQAVELIKMRYSEGS